MQLKPCKKKKIFIQFYYRQMQTTATMPGNRSTIDNNYITSDIYKADKSSDELTQ